MIFAELDFSTLMPFAIFGAVAVGVWVVVDMIASKGTRTEQRLEKLIADGASLEDVFAAKPTAEFDEAMGNNILFINRAYHSLQHEHE